jgi:Leucine-rich repeat (LRR) protein
LVSCAAAGASTLTLTLSGLGIQSILPGAFARVPNLTDLNMADNELAEWEAAWLRGVVGLQFLDVSGNHLLHVERDSFQNQTDLRSLEMSNNQLSTMDGWLRTYSSETLEFLDLGGNRLSAEGDPGDAVCASFAGLPALVRLYLNGNELTEWGGKMPTQYV